MNTMDTPPMTVNKTLGKSVSKSSVTPCRRVGLGRPSSGSLKKFVQVRNVNTPSDDPSHVNQSSFSTFNKISKTQNNDTPMNVLSKQDSKSKQPFRVRRCLTNDLKENKLQSLKRCCNEIENKTDISKKKSSVSCDGCVEESGTSNNYCEVKKIKLELPLPKSNNVNIQGPNEKRIDNPGELKQEITEETNVQLLMSLLEKKKKIDHYKVQATYAKKHNLEDLRAQTAKWRTAGQEALRHCVRLARQAGYPVTIHQLMAQHGFPAHLMGYNADDDEFE